MMKNKITLAIMASGLLAVVIAIYLWQAGIVPKKAPSFAGPTEKLTFGPVLSTTNSLVVIAQEKGYFRDNGLEVTLKVVPTGPAGVKQLLEGQIDVIGCTEYVLVHQVIKGREKSLRCLGATGNMQINRVLANRDRGIAQPDDLKGKRIGVARGTIAEFFLGRFLTFQHFRLDEVQIIDLNPHDLAAAMADGWVDAVVVWEPFTYDIMRKMGDRLLIWRGPAEQKFYNVLVSTDGTIKARAGALEKMFRALAQGEAFIKHNREESLTIIANWLKLNKSVIKNDWLNGEYNLSFDQPLVITMEDVAHWLMKNKFTEQTKMTDFLDYFEAGPLAKAVPKAVQIVIPKSKDSASPVQPGGLTER